MAPAIHPVDLIQVLRLKHLTPAIVFLTSRRACDEAVDAFDQSQATLSPERIAAIGTVLQQLVIDFPSITDHPLIPIVQRYGVAAHHAGHLPSWKIVIEELMRQGYLDAVFATTTLAAGVDFPARTVVITQSSIRKSRDFADLTISEIQQLAGRGGRRGKDFIGFVVITPSPYIDLPILAKGLTGFPEPIDSQFVISYPMVLNLLKAYQVDYIQGILAKSFAQFQLDQRVDIHQEHLETVRTQLDPYGPRACANWITQWQQFDLAKRRKTQKRRPQMKDSPQLAAQLPFLNQGRIVGLHKGPAMVLRQYRSRSRQQPMISTVRANGTVAECPASTVTHIYDRVLEVSSLRTFPWCTADSLDQISKALTQLPPHLRPLPILVDQEPAEDETLTNILSDEFPCPACSFRHACQKDHATAIRLRQKSQRLTKTIQALRTGLWHRFQERADILQHLGYLTPSFGLTSLGEWARFIRIDHSLLITELIRMEAFVGIEPALLTGILACIAHDDDRPGAHLRVSSGLGTMLHQVRRVADTLAPYEDPPLLRSDVATLAERWVATPDLSWASFVRMTNMAEGDVYRLLARTLEFLSQIKTIRSTHPDLADIAKEACTTMQREVLKELP